MIKSIYIKRRWGATHVLELVSDGNQALGHLLYTQSNLQRDRILLVHDKS